MNLRLALSRPTRSAPLLLAGAAVLAAPLLFFAAQPREAPVAPAAVPAPGFAPASRENPAMRSYSYYPEQLAALSSLNSFAPVADAGRPAPASSEEPSAPRRAARIPEAPRRAETLRRQAVLTPMAAPLPSAEPAPKQQGKQEGWKIFGLSVPKPGWPDGEALRGQAASWRDAAASLPDKAVALRDHIAGLWPPRRDAKPVADPATNLPRLAN